MLFEKNPIIVKLRAKAFVDVGVHALDDDPFKLPVQQEPPVSSQP